MKRSEDPGRGSRPTEEKVDKIDEKGLKSEFNEIEIGTHCGSCRAREGVHGVFRPIHSLRCQPRSPCETAQSTVINSNETAFRAPLIGRFDSMVQLVDFLDVGVNFFQPPYRREAACLSVRNSSACFCNCSISCERKEGSVSK
jgi:hypothetical protein